MRGVVNDWLRLAIGRCICVAGAFMNCFQQLRIRMFTLNQKRLKRKYETQTTNGSDGGKFAYTSGSAGEPKRILYTKRRLRRLKFVFSDMFVRACWNFGIDRPSLYVFSAFEPDESLTSLLLDEIDLPNYLSTLQAPYRVQHHSAIRALAAEYGATAVRLWLITIANPGVLYSTNPSTLSTFFDELSHRWRESSSLIRHWCRDSKRFNRELRKIAHRIDSRGSAQRLHAIATSDSFLPIERLAPAVEAYICWTGGYVKPFLDRLQKYLPAPRYRLIPMYSMSTETIETTSQFAKHDEVSFIPLAPGVVYEFLEHANHERLIDATDLEPGKVYEMIVSDAYGLRRYRTGDLFLCRRRIGNLPDLVFLRRRGLEYSFTGEKLTAEQVSIVFAQLRSQRPLVFAEKYLSCVPSAPSDALPHYTVVLIGNRTGSSDLDEIAARCDELLCEVNCEYRSKRASGRLGAVRLIETNTRDFAARFASSGSWESQFKFLPFCPHLTWHDELRVS